MLKIEGDVFFEKRSNLYGWELPPSHTNVCNYMLFLVTIFVCLSDVNNDVSKDTAIDNKR